MHLIMAIGCFTVYIFFALILVIPLLFADMVTGAFVTLGFSSHQAVFILFASLAGAFINIPVKTWLQPDGGFYARRKVLAVNIGGAVIPGMVSLWEIYRIFTEFSKKYPYAAGVFTAVLILNTVVCYMTARPEKRKGIVLPAFIPPIVVSIPSVIFAPGIAPVVAFPAGVLGVLLGADILHLKDIKRLDGPVGSIGGAGTFDGIFLCGILSVFLTG